MYRTDNFNQQLGTPCHSKTGKQGVAEPSAFCPSHRLGLFGIEHSYPLLFGLVYFYRRGSQPPPPPAPRIQPCIRDEPNKRVGEPSCGSFDAHLVWWKSGRITGPLRNDRPVWDLWNPEGFTPGKGVVWGGGVQAILSSNICMRHQQRV